MDVDWSKTQKGKENYNLKAVQDMGVTAPSPLLEKSVQSAGYTQIMGESPLSGHK